MIKFLLGVAIVAFGGFCGWLLSAKYRRRKAFFTQLKDFNDRFLSEIAYYRRPVRAFISSYAYQGEFRELLEEYQTLSKEGISLSASLDKKGRFDFLKAEEKTELADYFQTLGRGDSSSQKGYFTAAKNRLEEWRTQAETQAKRYADLYVKIGILCGLLVLILIV